MTLRVQRVTLASICFAAVLAVAVTSSQTLLVRVSVIGIASMPLLLGALLGRASLARKISLVTVGLTFLDIMPVSLGPVSSVRLYQVVSLTLIVLVLPRGQLRGGLWGLAAIYSVFTALSGLWSVALSDTVPVALGQFYLLYLFIVIVHLQRSKILSAAETLRALGVGAAISSVFGCLQFVGSYAGLRWQIFDVLGIPWHRPAGLMSEPDWGGLAAAVGLIIVLLDPTWKTLRRTSIAACAVMIVLSGARAVWVGSLAAALVFVVLQRDVRLRKIRSTIVMSGFVTLFLGILVVALNPSSFSRFDPAAVQAGVGDAGAANSRLGTVNLILSQAGTNLVYGHGAGTLASATEDPRNRMIYSGGGVLNTGHGSANLFLTNLWDGGLIGLTITTLLVGAWWRYAKAVGSHEPRLVVLTSLLIVDFQFNNGIRFGFVWVIMGTCVAYQMMLRDNSRDGPRRALEGWRSLRVRL